MNISKFGMPYFGGRTECVKTYVKCTQGQNIFHFDITSEYPLVNALDDYPVDFKQVYKPTLEEIMDNSFIVIIVFCSPSEQFIFTSLT